jgi:hypothetical protein
MPARDRQLTYEDLVQLVERVKSASQFSEFRLKVSEIELSLRRSNGAARPQPQPTPAPIAEAAADGPKSGADEPR